MNLKIEIELRMTEPCLKLQFLNSKAVSRLPSFYFAITSPDLETVIKGIPL